MSASACESSDPGYGESPRGSSPLARLRVLDASGLLELGGSSASAPNARTGASAMPLCPKHRARLFAARGEGVEISGWTRLGARPRGRGAPRGEQIARRGERRDRGERVLEHQVDVLGGEAGDGV